MRVYSSTLEAAAEDQVCGHCRRYIPKNSLCRRAGKRAFCIDHLNQSCQSTPHNTYVFGNFQIQWDDAGFTLTFDPDVVLQADIQSCVTCRTPLILFGLRRCFQLEVFRWDSERSEAGAPENVDLQYDEQKDERVTLRVQFPEPAEQPMQSQQDQQYFMSQPAAFPGVHPLSQLQITPRFTNVRECHFTLGPLEFALYLNYPPSNCRQLFYHYVVLYVLRADVARRLMKLSPATDYLTEEFSAVMFKPSAEQSCRVVQFDFEGKPLFIETEERIPEGEGEGGFKKSGNDTFELTGKMDESKVLIYQYTQINPENINQIRRRDRLVAALLRGYIPLNMAMTRFMHQQLYLMNKTSQNPAGIYKPRNAVFNEAITPYLPLAAVPAKVVTELYTKHIPKDQIGTMLWNYEDNFSNIYVRFYNKEDVLIPETISRLSELNGGRGESDEENVEFPHGMETCLLINMHDFYANILKPARADEDRKLCGTSGHVPLGPYWYNLFLTARVSFPNYQFNFKTCVDIRTGLNTVQQSSGQQEVPGFFQPGSVFEYQVLDQLFESNELYFVDHNILNFSDADAESFEPKQSFEETYVGQLREAQPQIRYLQNKNKLLELDTFDLQVYLEEFKGVGLAKATALAQRNAQIQQLSLTFATAHPRPTAQVKQAVEPPAAQSSTPAVADPPVSVSDESKLKHKYRSVVPVLKGAAESEQPQTVGPAGDPDSEQQQESYSPSDESESLYQSENNEGTKDGDFYSSD